MKWMLVFLSTACFAEQSVYCPQNSSFVSLGMNPAQVLQACGTPTAKMTLNTPAFKKVPVTQLIYTALDTGSFYPTLNPTFYDQWSLPSGTSGILLEIDIIDNKVSAININGSGANQSTLCPDVALSIGDPVQKVYSACGQPGRVNQTFVKQYISSSAKPEVWTYVINQYQPPIKFTIMNNQVVDIEN